MPGAVAASVGEGDGEERRTGMTRVAEVMEVRQLASQIVGDLTNGLSVLMTGLPGSGRSYLARLVAQDLARLRVNAVILRGNSLLVDRPLSALNLSDPKSEDPAKANGGSVVTYAAARLESLIDLPKSVIIIDDADEMDPLTAGLVASLRARRNVPLLVIAVSETDPGDTVDKLVAAGQPGVTVRLSGLSFEGVTQMVDRMLDEPVAADAVSQIALLSGGLPGLVENIVHLASRNGRLVKQDGTWTTCGPLLDPGLRFCLLPLLRGLERADIDCLIRLAEGEDIEADQTGHVHRLTERGVFHYDQASPTGYVFPPALGEWLLRDSGLTPASADHADVSPIDLGRWPTSLSGAEAAALANRIRSHWYADLTRLWQAWKQDRCMRTAVPLLTALLSGAANDERIDLVLRKTPPDQTDPMLSAELTILASVYRAEWHHDLAGAVADLRALGQASPGLATGLTGYICHLTLVGQRTPDAAMLDRTGHNPPDCDILTAARIETLVAQGRVKDAAEELTRLVPTRQSTTIIKQAFEAFVLVLGDDVRAGVDLAIAHLWQALADLDLRSLSGYAYVATLGLAMLGRFDELQSIVEIVYRLSDSSAFHNRYKTGLFMLGCLVSGWQGRPDYAHNLAVQAKSLRSTTGPFPAMLGACYDDGSVQQRWDTVDDLLNRGYMAAAVFLAVQTAEANPAAARAAAVIRQGGDSQSPVLRALSRYISAIVAGDPDQFRLIVPQLRAACGPLDSTRATVTWALMLRQRGDLAGWLAKAADAWRESSAISGRCAGLFDRLAAAVNLSEREAEVAGLAIKGLSSQEIADLIGIAMRTVEAHLHTAYRKAGVGNRDQLRQIATSWLNLSTQS